MYEKAITYNPVTRRFDLYLDGILVGAEDNYLDADVALNELITRLMLDEPADTPEGSPDAERGRAWR